MKVCISDRISPQGAAGRKIAFDNVHAEHPRAQAGHNNSTGALLALNDDTVLGVNRDSQLTYLVIGVVPGTDLTLQSLEPSFHQDLNGDGVIGVPPPASSAFQMAILPALNAPTVLPTATVIVPTSGDTVTVSDLFSHAADDAHGNAVITVAADQSIKVQDISTQILQQHLSDFHLF